jgi:L-erythro-3,5-diaminohexanoate dehydrogenase
VKLYKNETNRAVESKRIYNDIEETLALAALDVGGAATQTRKLAKKKETVLILGAAGKSGLLCCYEAKKAVGQDGKVIGLVRNKKSKDILKYTGFCNEIIVADAKNSNQVLNEVLRVNDGKEVDICINSVNAESTEVSSILPVRDEGIVYFFSMETSFAKAALGAKGAGKDVTMIIGNGYTKKHDDIILEDLRECDTLRTIFKNLVD